MPKKRNKLQELGPQSSQFHFFQHVTNILLEAFITYYLNVRKKSEDKPSYAQIAHHICREQPMVVVLLCKTLLRLRVFLKHKVVGQLSHTQRYDGGYRRKREIYRYIPAYGSRQKPSRHR